MIKLRSCPFCGGPAEPLGVTYGFSPGVQVRCARCHASTQTLVEGYDPRTGNKVPLDALKEKVSDLWNRRAAV